MKTVLIIGVIALQTAVAMAQLSPLPVMTKSVTGQFIVVDASTRGGVSPSWLRTNSNLLELESSFLAVSAERIKQALLRELHAGQNWSGRIYLAIRPAQGEDDTVTIVSERFRDTWNYRVELPQFVERRRFVRGLVEALLQEMANRGDGHAAEIPAWLMEGLAEKITGSQGEALLLAPPHQMVGGLNALRKTLDERDYARRESARRAMRESRPLTIGEISWPTSELLEGERYRLNAQLFVGELLRLKNGDDCLRGMIGQLGKYYNWQTAFYGSFKSHFATPLDLEKWWTLQTVHFTGRDFGQFWSADESREKLGQILRTSVAVRRTAADSPALAVVTLQVLIREWDTNQQEQTLRQKMQELQMARLRVSPDFVPLVEEYHRVLLNYSEQRARASFSLPDPRNARPSLKKLVQNTCTQLDDLDRKLATLNQTPKPSSDGGNGENPVGLTATGSNL